MYNNNKHMLFINTWVFMGTISKSAFASGFLL
jgi:hypothetical protein